MIGILIGLAISWLLLWFIEKKGLNALGISPTQSRAMEFGTGFLASALFCILNILLLTAFYRNTWAVNKAYTLQTFFVSGWWTLKSVLFEELLFRGAFLYIAIKRLGIHKACILSAIAFGIYHWFTYNAWSNPGQMIYVFIMTGIAGLMFAYAFARTKSLYFPVGLHLGWNLLNIVVFSNGPLGNQVLVAVNAKPINTFQSLVSTVCITLLLPLFVFWYLKRYKNR